VLELCKKTGDEDLIKFIARFNIKEWYVMVLGLIFTVIARAWQPVQGIFFAKAIVALAQPLILRD
jgi:ATP-binding cassette, subfamily B (MDR/TAP), member 1